MSRLRAELAREFPLVPAEQLDRLAGEVLARLLEDARFEDFVPLLAHRRIRELLLAGGPHRAGEGTGELEPVS